MIIYLNDAFIEHTDAAVDPLDRGLLLGEGVFETMRVEEGQPLFHVAHFSRLARGARLMEIPWKTPNDELLAICHQVIDANNLTEARLRITLTRGESGASPMESEPHTAPTLIVHAFALDSSPLHEQRTSGWRLTRADYPLNHRSPFVTIKTTSYAERIHARRTAVRAGAHEALFLNADGLVAEGAMTNLFAVTREGKVITPLVEDGALPGVQRLKVGIIAERMRIPYEECHVTLDELTSAAEVFATNVIVELMPVVAIDGRLIGDGNPGPICQRLHQEHRRDVNQFLHAMRRG